MGVSLVIGQSLYSLNNNYRSEAKNIYFCVVYLGPCNLRFRKIDWISELYVLISSTYSCRALVFLGSLFKLISWFLSVCFSI